MALRLILGPAASGKSDRLYESLSLAARLQQPVMVLPTALDVRNASLELARRGVSGVAVRTLDEAVANLWMLHGDGRRLVTPATRAAFVQSVIEDSAPEELGESGSTWGFAMLLADLARRVVSAVPADPTAEGLARLLALYRRTSESAGFIEPAAAMEILARQAPDPGGPWGVARFTNFDPVQEALLASLARARDVIVALTWTEGAAMAGLDPLVERFRAKARSVEITTERSSVQRELLAFSEALFEAKEPLEFGSAVSFFEAGGDDAECALVARSVRESLDAGSRAGSIAVVFRDPARRLGSLEAALRAERVPSHFDVRVPFARTAFGAAILALLDACAGRGDVRERWLAFLMSPCSGIGAEAVARLDRMWRSEGIAPQSAFSAVRSAASAAPRSSVQLLELGRRVVGERIEAANAARWKELAGHALAHAQAARGVSEGVAPGLDAAAHRALLSAVSDTATIALGISENHFAKALHSVEVSTAPGERFDEVLVTEAHRLKGQRFDVVVLGGLNADEFSPEPRESLSGALMARLGRPVDHDERLVERALFHSVVTRAREQVVLLRKSADERGEPLRPSVFWDEALDVYRGVSAAADGELPEHIIIGRLSLAQTAEAAPAYLPGRKAVRAAAGAVAPSVPHRGVLSDPRVLSTMAQKRTFSVSEIEAYLKCPYRWFMDRALRPREIDRAFDAREKGSLAHQILADFYGAWNDRGHARVTPALLDEALEVLESTADACEKRREGAGRRGLAEELEIAESRAWARLVVEDDAEFLPEYRPVRHEVSFGSDDDTPVFVKDLQLRGFVDRIDEGPEGLVVIDYKATADVKGRGSFASEGLIQVPVYARVVGELLGRPVVGAVYRSLSSRAVRGAWLQGTVDFGERGCSRDGVDRDEFDEVLEDAVVRMTDAANRIRSGEIAAQPSGGACRVCGFATQCGVAMR